MSLVEIKDFNSLINSLINSQSWTNNISKVKENIHNLVFQDHYLIRKYYIYFLNRVSSKGIYNFLISQKEEKTSSRLYY